MSDLSLWPLFAKSWDSGVRYIRCSSADIGRPRNSFHTRFTVQRSRSPVCIIRSTSSWGPASMFCSSSAVRYRYVLSMPRLLAPSPS